MVGLFIVGVVIVEHYGGTLVWPLTLVLLCFLLPYWRHISPLYIKINGFCSLFFVVLNTIALSCGVWASVMLFLV